MPTQVKEIKLTITIDDVGKVINVEGGWIGPRPDPMDPGWCPDPPGPTPVLRVGNVDEIDPPSFDLQENLSAG
jgi:hypothetical protein